MNEDITVSAPASKADAAAEEKPNSRSGRRAASRRKLLDAARGLFVSKGYHDTRPQDITKEAGLGHGTFYIHFTDKRDCFLAFVAEAQAELMATIEAANQDGPHPIGQVLNNVLEAIRVYSEAHPGVLETVLSDPTIIAAGEAPQQTIVDIWAEDWANGLREARARGEVRADLDCRMTGYLIVGMLQSMMFYARVATRAGEADYGLAQQKVIDFIIAAVEPQ